MKGINWKFKNRSNLGSILMIVFGAVLVMNPDSASALVSAILGWGLLVVGVALVIGGFVDGRAGCSIGQGLLFVVVSSWLRRNPLMIAKVVGVLLGLTAVQHGWRALENAQRSKRNGGFWIPGAVLAAVELLVGVRLIFSPLMMTMEEADLPERMAAWVKAGGVWVAGPLTDIRNAIGAHYTDRAMGYVEEMTGCRLVATIPDSGVVVKSKWADGEPMSAHYMQQVFTPAENGRVLASVTEGYASIIGTALVQKVPCGKGAIWLLGTLPDSKDLQKLMAMVCAEAGIEVPEVTGTVTVGIGKGSDKNLIECSVIILGRVRLRLWFPGTAS